MSARYNRETIIHGYERPRKDAWYADLTDAELDELYNKTKRMGWDRIRDHFLSKLKDKPSRSAFYRFTNWYAERLRLHKAPTASLQYLENLSQAVAELNMKVDAISTMLSKTRKPKKSKLATSQ